jgi:hypothetical protein
MTNAKKTDRPKYIFTVIANAAGGYDVTRRTAGSAQSWVMVSYDDRQDADNLKQQLDMLELRVWARRVRQARKKG